MSLRSGQKLKSIWWPTTIDGDGGVVTVGQVDCTSITVFEEHGYGSMMPWVRVERDTRDPVCFNVAMLEGYELMPEEEPKP